MEIDLSLHRLHLYMMEIDLSLHRLHLYIHNDMQELIILHN